MAKKSAKTTTRIVKFDDPQQLIDLVKKMVADKTFAGIELVKGSQANVYKVTTLTSAPSS